MSFLVGFGGCPARYRGNSPTERIDNRAGLSSKGASASQSPFGRVYDITENSQTSASPSFCYGDVFPMS
ncbi:hypothetical protein VUR80DRAFT_7159 [Thermomyces stellatus]